MAEAIHGNLEPKYAEVTVWTQDVFKLSEYTLPSLVKKLKQSDYTIFIFKPDDVTKMRNEEFKTVRDNVVFELGLSMGILGIEKVFLLAPSGEEDLHLPTDLLGLTVGKYNGNRSDGNLKAATSPFCSDVKQKIKN